jgi:hypothetical protein
LAAPRAEDLVGPARDHLVDVHVRLGAGAGLPDDEGELPVVFAREDLVGGGDDGLGEARLEQAELPVDLGSDTLDEGERADEWYRHALAADAEVLA